MPNAVLKASYDYGNTPRQYFSIESCIFFFVSSVCFFPYIGFFLPCLARLILNFVAVDNRLLNLLAIGYELL